MENIKNAMSSKLIDFFNNRLNNLEVKALKQLRDLEILKYDSYLILNEGIKNKNKIKFLIVENNEELEEIDVDEYKQADLFLSYFDRNLNKKENHFKIEQVNQFTIITIRDDKQKSNNFIPLNKGKYIKEPYKNENNLFNISKLNAKDAKFDRSPPQTLLNIGNLVLEKSKNHKDQLNLTTRNNYNNKSNSGQNNNIIPKISNDQTKIQNQKDNNSSGNKEEYPNCDLNQNTNPLKIEVKRNYLSTDKQESASVNKNPLSTNNRKNYVCNNILYESVSNTSNIHNDSFFRTDNFSKTILETEINEINYVLTETNEHKNEKRIYSKQKKTQINRCKGNNFIQKVRDALNFSKTIRHTHLNSNKNNNLNENKDSKNTETSFCDSSNVNNISIYSKKENQGSGNNNTKKLVNIPYLDPNTIVKDNSPIANMINEYFDKLESKQISKNLIASKDANNMNNIINIGCANFISNNINNNFSNEKILKGSEDYEKPNKKEIHDKSYEDAHSNVSMSVDKINENIRNGDNYNDFKSPEFGYNNKARSIIRVKKPEDELDNTTNNNDDDHKTFNAKNLNIALAAMGTDKIFKDEAEKNLKQKLNFNLNKINNGSFNVPISMGMNTSRNKTLSYDTDKMDFYLSQKNLNKRNFNRENFNKKNIYATNDFVKRDNNLIDNYLRKQAGLKKNANYLSSRSKTSKNISLNPVEQITKTDAGVENSIGNSENCNPISNKKTFTLKNVRENKKILSNKNNENKTITNEIAPNEEKKIVIIDKMDSDKDINAIAENVQESDQEQIIIEENSDKVLNVQNKNTDDQQDINNHTQFKDKVFNDLNISENQNDNNNLIIRTVSNEREPNHKIISKPANAAEHRKNFSFGAGNFDKNSDKNKKDTNYNSVNTKQNTHTGKNNAVSANNANRQENLNSNSKMNSSLTNNLYNTVSTKKLNPSCTSNKKIIESESLNKKITTKNKPSLEIKTDLIDSIKETEVNKVVPESTRNSVSYKENKFELNALNKINTTKNFSKNKIELIHNNQKEENNELKNSIKNTGSKHTKTLSKDNFSTSLNLGKNSEVKDKSETKIKNNIKNNENSKDYGTKKSSASLDKNLSIKPKISEVSENKKPNCNEESEIKVSETNNNNKKLTKNLSIINEKENSDKKPNSKFPKRMDKNIRKNFSMDLDNLNTSVEKDTKDNHTKKINQSQLKFNAKVKENKKEEGKEKDKELAEDSKGKKPSSKEKNMTTKEKSKSKDKIDISLKHPEGIKKDVVNIKKQNHRLSKSMVIDNDVIQAEKNSHKDSDNNKIEGDRINLTEKEPTINNNSEKPRSNSIKNNNLILNNLNEINKENKSKNDMKNENDEQSKRRSKSNDRKISLKRNSNTNNNIEGQNQNPEDLNESDKKNKRKNAFKNDSNDVSEKDKIIANDGQIKIPNNPPKRNILKNKIKKSSLVETENVNIKKRISDHNKIKEELKTDKDSKSKKSLKGDEKERISTSKVRKVIRPSNLKNKTYEETNETDPDNPELQVNNNEETNEDNPKLEKNQIIKDSNTNRSKEVLEQNKEAETRIDPVQFDNLIRNIKIDDDTLFKHKEDKYEEAKIDNHSSEINQPDPKKAENNINQNQGSYLGQIEEKMEKHSSDQNLEIIGENKGAISFIRKITFDVSGDDNENAFEDSSNTPKFSPFLNKRNVSENKLNKIEESVSANNLEKQFNEIKLEEIKQIPIGVYIFEKKKTKKSFGDKKEEAFNLIFNSDYLSLEKKIFLFHNLKPLRNSMSEEEKKKFKISCLREKIKLNEKILSKYLNEPEYSALITEPLKPSKTAKNGLSLFSKDEENNLVNKEQPKEITNFFKFVALLFKIEIKEEDIIEDNLIKTFFKKVIPDNMTLKTFFIETSNNIYLINDKNFDLIHSFIKESPEVIKSTDLLRKNRTCSYMSFLVKEIYDYYSAKATDGFYIYKLRNLYEQTLKLKDSLEKEINNKNTNEDILIKELI